MQPQVWTILIVLAAAFCAQPLHAKSLANTAGMQRIHNSRRFIRDTNTLSPVPTSSSSSLPPNPSVSMSSSSDSLGLTSSSLSPSSSPPSPTSTSSTSQYWTFPTTPSSSAPSSSLPSSSAPSSSLPSSSSTSSSMPTSSSPSSSNSSQPSTPSSTSSSSSPSASSPTPFTPLAPLPSRSSPTASSPTTSSLSPSPFSSSPAASSPPSPGISTPSPSLPPPPPMPPSPPLPPPYEMPSSPSVSLTFQLLSTSFQLLSTTFQLLSSSFQLLSNSYPHAVTPANPSHPVASPNPSTKPYSPSPTSAESNPFWANGSFIGLELDCDDEAKVCLSIGRLMHEPTGQCYPLGDIRPCEDGHSLVLDAAALESGQLRTVCRPNDPCDGVIMAYDGRCYSGIEVRSTLCNYSSDAVPYPTGLYECRCGASECLTETAVVQQPSTPGRCALPDFTRPVWERKPCSAEAADCWMWHKLSFEGECYEPLSNASCPEGQWLVEDVQDVSDLSATCASVQPCGPGQQLLHADGLCHSEEEIRDKLCPGDEVDPLPNGEMLCSINGFYVGGNQDDGMCEVHVYLNNAEDDSATDVVHPAPEECTRNDDNKCTPEVEPPS